MKNTKEVLLSASPFNDLTPLLCGEEACVAHHAFGPATRNFYLLHYVLSGKGTFTTPRGTFPVHKGQLFIIKPFEITRYQADAKSPWHYCWVGFTNTLPIDFLLQQDVITLPQAEHLFHAIRESDHLNYGREFYVCAKIYELLSHLEAFGSKKKSQSLIYVEQIQNYINANYMKPITVELLAEKVGLDRSYFSRIFKNYTGKSPQQYLVDFRLEKAAELISTHHYRPRDAALNVGYHDFFNFSKMFKKKYGISPRAYQPTPSTLVPPYKTH